MQVPHKPGLISTFCFAYGVPCNRAEEAVCQKYIWLIGRREGTSGDGMLGDHHLISVAERWKKLQVAVHRNIVRFYEFTGKSVAFLTTSQVEFAIHSQLWHLQSFRFQGLSEVQA